VPEGCITNGKTIVDFSQNMPYSRLRTTAEVRTGSIDSIVSKAYAAVSAEVLDFGEQLRFFCMRGKRTNPYQNDEFDFEMGGSQAVRARPPRFQPAAMCVFDIYRSFGFGLSLRSHNE
jgi:hypothetical protein